MTKICTSIKQSKKLLELGIDRKSSDMYYWCGEDLRIGGYKAQDEELDIPAWSLTALLGLMPKIYEYENDPEDGGCQPNLCKGWDNNQWHIVYRPSLYITDWYDDPLDAAFQMVVWLKENGKIKI